MNECDIILLACRNNSWCVKPFVHMFKKYWPGETIRLVAENDYANDPVVKFDKIPRQYILGGQVPSHWFSNSLKWAMNSNASGYCIILLADYWFYNPVNMEAMAAAHKYMKENPDVIRVDIGKAHKPNSLVQVNDYIWECPQERRDCFYPISLVPGLWNKKHYQSILVEGNDPWTTEKSSHNIYMNERKDLRSVWCEPGPISYTNVLRGRDNYAMVARREWIDEMRQFIPHQMNIMLEN